VMAGATWSLAADSSQDRPRGVPHTMAGTLIGGRYKLLELIGEGGMGEVWLAFDRELQTRVAIKRLPQEFSSRPKFLKSIRQEAKIAMQLTHPGIARLYNFESTEGENFLVMEYVSGVSLDRIIAERGRLTLAEMLRIAKPLADAIDYAHTQNVLHRDIKPANIIVQLAEGGAADLQINAVKMLDFGIACMMHETARLFTGKTDIGTLPYMSAEQVRGDVLSPRSDVYAFAATLYECLCGHPPFYSGDVGWQIINKDPPEIDGLPPDVNLHLLRALSRDPNRRPGSCAQLIRLLSGETNATAAGPVRPADRFVRELAAHEKSVITLYLGADDRHLVTGSADRTAKLWDITTGRFIMTFKGHRGGIRSACLSSDLRFLVTGSWDTSIRLWEIATGHCLRTCQGHRGAVCSVRISRDDKFIVSAAEDGLIKIWELESGFCLRTLDGHGAAVNAACFTHDGKRIVSASSDRSARLWNAETGACLRSYEVHTGAVNDVCLSPNDKIMVTAGADRAVLLWELESGVCRMDFSGHLEPVRSVCLSPDGLYLATGSADRTARVWNAKTGQCLRSYEDHAGTVNAVCLSSDAAYVVAGVGTGEVKSWLVPREA